MKAKLLLLSFFGALFSVSYAADTAGKVAFRLLDADTGTGIARARVVIASAWQQWGSDKHRYSLPLLADPMKLPAPPSAQAAAVPPLPPGRPPIWTSYETADAEGRFTSPLPAGDVTLTVMNERGIAHLREDAWSREGGDVRVKLHPWASVTGIVTRNGKPAAGVILTASRTMTSASIGSMFDLFTPPLTHGLSVLTDAQGRFAFERLLPTAVDSERHVPYVLSEFITDGPPPSAEDLKARRASWFAKGIDGWSIDIDHDKVTLAAGEKGELSLAGLPRCKRVVKGRLVWADGKPVTPADIAESGAAMPSHLRFWPDLHRGSSGSGPHCVLGEDGHFALTLLLAGKWVLTAGKLHPVGRSTDFEFQLPPCQDDSGKGEPYDLGEITFHRRGVTEKTPVPAPVPDASGKVDTVITLLDDRHKPSGGAAVKIERLESNQEGSSHYFYPKNLPSTRSGKDGVTHVKVPAIHRDTDGKDWKITHAGLEITQDGFEPLTHQVALGERSAMLALKKSLSVAVRVTKDGRALPLKQVQFNVGWTHGWDCFEHKKWKADETLALRRVNLKDGAWQVQAGHLDADHWRWFSQVAEVDVPGKTPPVELVLHRGESVPGQIAAEVPRPVKRGMVRVLVRMPSPSSADARPIYWSDWQALDAEGKFSFRGLPQGDAWIAASCDGWISEERKPAQRQPGDPNWGEPISGVWNSQPVRVAADGAAITIAMTRTGTVVFRFKNQDGTPVTDFRPYWDPKLQMGPDQQSLQSTDRALDHMLSEVDENSYWPGDFLPRLAERPDATGTLRLENLPPTRIRLGASMPNDRTALRPLGADAIKSDHPHDHFAPFQTDVKAGETVVREFTVETVGR
jgi:hypothetical protein